jgi:hypothetical protein
MPKFPLYIPSKGRYEFMVTSRALTAMGVHHNIVVEPQEVDVYRASVTRFGLSATIVELDLSYKSRYELCDSLGLTKSTGPGPARNFAWEHSRAQGYEWHWVMDDNIKGFYRLNRNLKVPTTSPAFWGAMEDFALRYKNVAMAGPNYFMFASRKSKMPPFVTNTRIYSCNLIRNDTPFHWRGRYNEDTILSLDMLKAGWCTIQFNAFLQEKMETQKLPGGNTTEFYLAEGKKRDGAKYSDTGTIAKSQMLCDVHPDVSTMAWKFQRWHHHVDYGRFKTQKLIRNLGVKVQTGIDNYGMTLVEVSKNQDLKCP